MLPSTNTQQKAIITSFLVILATGKLQILCQETYLAQSFKIGLQETHLVKFTMFDMNQTEILKLVSHPIKNWCPILRLVHRYLKWLAFVAKVMS